MTECYHRTKIQIEFNSNFVLPETPEKNIWIVCKPSDVVSENFLTEMESLGLPVRSLTLFYCPPFCNPSHAHVDTARQHHFARQSFAMNYIIGGKNSRMVWYKPLLSENVETLDENVPVDNKTGSRGQWPTYLLNWPISNETLEQVNECIIEGITLVRVNMPHAIFTEEDDRWCVSMRFYDDHIITWDEICEIMREKNLLWT